MEDLGPLNVDKRCLGAPACSSYALIALLTRLTSTRRANLQDKSSGREAPSCWRRLLSGFLAEVRHDVDDIEVFLDARVVCSPGLPPQGKSPIVIPCSQGVVDLGVFEPFRDTMLVSSVLDLCGSQAEIGLDSLLLASFEGGARWAWLMTQLVWRVGSALEVRLCSLAGQAAAISSGPLWTRQRRVAAQGFGNFAKTVSMKGRLERIARKEVANYWLASRQAFRNEVAISLAVDATRVGGRGLFVGFACAPDNKAAWLPPQATRSVLSGSPRHTNLHLQFSLCAPGVHDQLISQIDSSRQ